MHDLPSGQTKASPWFQYAMKGRSYAALLTALGMGAWGSAAVGQEPDRQMSTLRTIDEIVVTARRREESGQSVPIAISAVAATTLENFRVDNFDDLQTLIPSLTVSSSAGRQNSPVYSLRGISPTESIFGQDPTVAVYFADVIMSPAKGSNLGMYDLESVQVLKGPQGTLFGRNTTGGAIQLMPKRPGRDYGSELMMGVGRFGRYETEVALDLPVTDGLALRVAGRAVNSDGYQKNVVTGKALGGETIRSMRLSAVWEPSEGLENYTVISWDDVEFNGPGHVLEAVNPGGAEGALGLFNGGPPFHLPSIFAALERAQGRDVHRVESDMDQLSTVKVWGVVNTTTLSLSDSMSVKSILAYRDLEAFETLDLDASLIPNLFTSWQTTEMEHASYEFQLLGSAWDNRLDWLAGLYWYYENGIEDSPGDVLEGVNPNTPFMQKAIMKNNSYSAFLHGNYRFDPAWTLSAGVRWTYDEKELTLNAWSPAGCVLLGDELQPLPMTNCFMPLSERFTQPTGTISLEYTPREEVMLYASSRLGYRAGGFNARGSQPIEYQPFDAETVLDLELGLKADWSLWNWQMRSNVALYHQWYDDIQRTVGVTNPVGVPGTAVENAAEAKVLGLEWEQTIMFTDRLSLQLSYAWLDPSYNEWREPATGADLSDTPFYFSPKHSASAILTYEYPLRSDDGVLWLSLSGAWRDDMWISPLNTIVHIRETPPDVQHTLKQDAYALFDLSVGWRQMLGSPVDLTAYVKNMTDQKYALGGIQTYHSFGLATRVYGEPRQYGVRLKYRF